MDSDRHLNREKAVTNFLANYRDLAFLPFITDQEIHRLFGEEVDAALQELGRYNRQKGLCRDCARHCCTLVNCELYSPVFNVCPVYSFRPPLCRMHFCGNFAGYSHGVTADLADIFLDSLLTAARRDNLNTGLFDCPPLSPLIPCLLNQILPIIKAARECRAEAATVFTSIENKLADYFRSK